MNPNKEALRDKLNSLSREWMASGLPSGAALRQAADGLTLWKQTHGVTGIWPRIPLMMTATIDDGIGQGIEIISMYAKVAGLRVRSLGLMQQPDHIIDTCRNQRPSILGLTILQLDSDDVLARIGHHLPPETALVAGGPVFKYDPDMALRCGVTYAAANVADFIDYLLKWEPGHGPTA